ncbi:MAG: DUF72 domain-containing protein [Candidatus Binatia bacterium]
MARGRLFVGTSGFSYKEWKPDFYPKELKNAEMLRYYAERLPSVEINNTFYRMPGEGLLRGWMEETPESFAFTLKAPQRITHFAKLANTEELLEYFLSTAAVLGNKLGAILFQCPPSLRYRGELLDDFLGALPRNGMRFAMEFRHPSWDEGGAEQKLAARAVAWCTVDGEGESPRLVETADFVYLRLRKSAYDETELAQWGGKVGAVLDRGTDAYVYFKHEDDPSGVRYALRLREMC